MTIQHTWRNALTLLAGGRSRFEPVAAVDLPQFMGPWRVLAVMDNPVERKFVDAVETYRMRPKNRIAVTFHWRDNSFEGPQQTHRFTGRVVDPGRNALWKMNVFPMISAKYVIIGLADNYEWAAVGHPSRHFAWILARDASLSPEVMTRIHAIFQRQGFNTEKFRKIPHQAP
ncbi:MAG: lipocalin family protein [Terrimicrobiaceae bacterium]|nr:lipocalin family protein [Terrimicrobiaceae bacterium]